MSINPSIFSLVGLVFDILGFSLISYTIIYPPQIGDDNVSEVKGAFDEPLFTNFNFLIQFL